MNGDHIDCWFFEKIIKEQTVVNEVAKKRTVYCFHSTQQRIELFQFRTKFRLLNTRVEQKLIAFSGFLKGQKPYPQSVRKYKIRVHVSGLLCNLEKKGQKHCLMHIPRLVINCGEKSSCTWRSRHHSWALATRKPTVWWSLINLEGEAPPIRKNGDEEARRCFVLKTVLLSRLRWLEEEVGFVRTSPIGI